MNRQQAIADIEALFPIDSEYSSTNEMGKKLLLEAIESCNWRKLPNEILFKYAELCQQEENKQTNLMLKKYKGRF